MRLVPALSDLAVCAMHASWFFSQPYARPSRMRASVQHSVQHTGQAIESFARGNPSFL